MMINFLQLLKSILVISNSVACLYKDTSGSNILIGKIIVDEVIKDGKCHNKINSISYQEIHIW